MVFRIAEMVIAAAFAIGFLVLIVWAVIFGIKKLFDKDREELKRIKEEAEEALSKLEESVKRNKQ